MRIAAAAVAAERQMQNRCKAGAIFPNPFSYDLRTRIYFHYCYYYGVRVIYIYVYMRIGSCCVISYNVRVTCWNIFEKNKQ